MRKAVLTAVAMMTMMTLTNCGNKTEKNDVAIDSDTIVMENNFPMTIFGVCADGTSMNTLQMITDSNDTLSLSIDKAKESGNVFGGLLVGDRMAVVTTGDRHEATFVLNINTLLGRWVMQNPLDGSSFVGIELKDGGIAESIDQSYISYKTWKISDGQLHITMVREGGSEEEETESYNLNLLNSDSLVYANPEDTLSYSRQK